MKVIYLISMLVVVSALALAYKSSRFGVASPEYRVVESDGAFEIREYPSMVAVETRLAGSDVAEGSSFMRLFRYISGSNEAEQKIAMTAPVMTSYENGEGRMSFIVPPGVAADGAPKPSSDDVELQMIPGGRFAAYRFNGSWDRARFEEAAEKLSTWLHERNLTANGDPIIANYDPPFTPSILRRNEVWYRLGP